MIDKPIMQNCCDAFRRALERGTDNEGYEPLVYRDVRDGAIKIGHYDLKPMRFCPWCGETIQQNEPR